MRVLVTEFMDEAALADFDDRFSVTYDPSLAEDRSRLLGRIEGATALIVRNKTCVDRELLDKAPGLKVVGRLGVGLDNIDLDACEDKGIVVHPATGANAISVAEYVLCAAMTLLRGAYHSNAEMIHGDWPRENLGLGREVFGRTLGLYGFGKIAQTIAPRAKALGMDVAAYDPFLPAGHESWQSVKMCSHTELIECADVLSLHVPLIPQTRNMIGALELDRMKPGAILINTSRGGVVDEHAVADALKSGKLGGAALDVFQSEPLGQQDGVIFSGAPNLILTPHISGVTREANVRVSDVTVRNVATALETKINQNPEAPATS